MVRSLLKQFSTRAGYALYPDVLPFFKMLQAKKKQPDSNPEWRWDRTIVGIITNSDDRVPEILNSFGLTVGPRRIGTTHQRSNHPPLESDVSFVVLSYDVGFEKPDPLIFEAAVQMGQETVAEEHEPGVFIDDFEKLYVGDSIEKDYFGARHAGWDSLLLQREADDNLKDSPMARRVVHAHGLGGNGEREVDVIKDLGALSRWSPGHKG